MSIQFQDAEHDGEIWSRRFEQNNTYKRSQDTEDEQKRCLSTADEHEQTHIVSIGATVTASAAAQASALGHDSSSGQTCLQDTEDDHERCLVCLSTAEVHKLKNISKQLQDTEDDHERCLVFLSSAEVQNIKNISKPLQDTEDDHERSGSSLGNSASSGCGSEMSQSSSSNSFKVSSE